MHASARESSVFGVAKLPEETIRGFAGSDERMDFNCSVLITRMSKGYHATLRCYFESPIELES